MWTENFSYPELFEYAHVILSCDLSSQISLGQKFDMVDNATFSVLLTIISSLIAYLELSIALVHMNIVRQRIRNNFRQSLMSKDTRKAARRSQPYKQQVIWQFKLQFLQIFLATSITLYNLFENSFACMVAP